MLIKLNQAQFFYSVAGEQNSRPMVVLHGGRGIGDHIGDFKAYFPLASQFKLIGYDQRGCGRSSLTPPISFEQLTDDLEAVRKSLGGSKKMVLIGGSFGGMIALCYAIKYPGSLSHLILRGTAPSHHHEKEAIENCIARLHKASSASAKMVHKLFSATEDDLELRLIWLALQPLYFEKFDADAALARTKQMYFHADTHKTLFENKEQYDLRGRLKEITAKTLVIVGANDWICPPSQSRIIAENIPNAELLEVPNCNHAVHVEANEEVVSAIREFIK